MNVKRYGHLMDEDIEDNMSLVMENGKAVWKDVRPRLYFSRESEDITMPTKREDDACYDLYPYFEEDIIVIPAHETKMISTGLRTWMPKGYFMRLMERGSTGTRGMGQRAGIVDQNYTGEIFVPITNHNDKPLWIMKEKAVNQFINKSKLIFNSYDIIEVDKLNSQGIIDIYPGQEIIVYPYEKAICQAAILPVPTFVVEEISKEDIVNRNTERGEGMLGSSNK